ncbi:Forkhead-associated protein [Isosphaera pallida ATCC 43644]|uniref:Forkhead-associated protein n=1 Tax=Isosphaera pallida (strain ATCC 43644 / DSM 9630 / IS1B) TaxID=575540 RepID=E8QWQ3_ISOPI|nr:FHA domain-containing protein [Isosphaera pallida]ADV62953.1 Forkhead-associated protein [Isosphaera pallida ATCC 43644]
MGGLSGSRTYQLAIAGALGAIVGLYLTVELVKVQGLWARDALAGMFLGGMIGFFLNAAEPWRDGAWLKLAREGTAGTLAGAIGGAIGLLIGEFVLGGFQGGLMGRSVSWAILGLGIGVSQGLAHRSWQRLRLGLIGGGLGGLGGGFLFELIRESLGPERYSISQGLGIVILGAGLGLSLALVEQALRRAWLVVLNGRQEGRIFLLGRSVSRIGLDERAEIGLFGDPGVSRRHGELRAQGDSFQFVPLDPAKPTAINGQPLDGPRLLRDGDRLELGRTLLVFRLRN